MSLIHDLHAGQSPCWIVSFRIESCFSRWTSEIRGVMQICTVHFIIYGPALPQRFLTRGKIVCSLSPVNLNKLFVPVNHWLQNTIWSAQLKLKRGRYACMESRSPRVLHMAWASKYALKLGMRWIIESKLDGVRPHDACIIALELRIIALELGSG